MVALKLVTKLPTPKLVPVLELVVSKPPVIALLTPICSIAPVEAVRAMLPLVLFSPALLKVRLRPAVKEILPVV